MLRVTLVSAPGPQTMTTQDGKTINYDNVTLGILNNELPNYLAKVGAVGLFPQLIKFKRNVRTIGFTNWSELLNKDIEIEYSVYGGKAEVRAVQLITK